MRRCGKGVKFIWGFFIHIRDTRIRYNRIVPQKKTKDIEIVTWVKNRIDDLGFDPVEILVSIASDQNAKDGDRISACKTILDYSAPRIRGYDISKMQVDPDELENGLGMLDTEATRGITTSADDFFGTQVETVSKESVIIDTFLEEQTEGESNPPDPRSTSLGHREILLEFDDD